MTANSTGKDFNIFQKVLVTDATFGSDPNVVFNMRGEQSFSFVNEGNGIVEYSFNGNILHGDLTPGTPTAAILFDNRRVSKIWFRLKSGTSSTVRVEAWAAI